MSTALVWFRRDLRLSDHPALVAALNEADRVVPVFCLDHRLLKGRHSSGPRTQFMLECLKDLGGALRQRDSGLVILDGAPEQRLPGLVGEIGADAVHASADVGPFAHRRDERVRRALRDAGAELHLHPGVFAVDDPGAIRTQAGGPYTVFTPYRRAWQREPRRDVIGTPHELPRLSSNLRTGRVLSLADLGLQSSLSDPPEGGEQAAHKRLTAFLSHGVREYAKQHDLLAAKGTSALSPYLHFGCISPREIEEKLPTGAGAQEFHRQLCWREFYAQVLAAFPRNARSEHQPRYRGALQWSHSHRLFDAWREGRTGYPVVDAAMRQLLREGWMHNRGRLIVGSFLTKDLGIDWRWGERWFMQMLLDGDEANNNGNWQWIASVGVDPQPPARRLYNPSLQQRRLDPEGTYVRRYVPELSRVPDAYLAEPWTMPVEVQQRARCVIGDDYPEPIVDHAEARREALERYAAAR